MKRQRHWKDKIIVIAAISITASAFLMGQASAQSPVDKPLEILRYTPQKPPKTMAAIREKPPQSSQISDIKTSTRWEEVSQVLRPKLRNELYEKGLQLGSPIFVRIFKETQELELWVKGPGTKYYLFKTYEICKYSGDLGPKLKQGDRQAPEGIYHVDSRSLNPNSRYHLSFDLGFPNAYDQLHGRTGSYLMVHGSCTSAGCYAMTDASIEEIYTLAHSALEAGQPLFWVHVFPFRPTTQRMKTAKKMIDQNEEWLPFWTSLRPAYDHFQKYRKPPSVALAKGNYVFF